MPWIMFAFAEAVDEQPRWYRNLIDDGNYELFGEFPEHPMARQCAQQAFMRRVVVEGTRPDTNSVNNSSIWRNLLFCR
eukprot:7067789-Karenia_brevis.AAC.1